MTNERLAWLSEVPQSAVESGGCHPSMPSDTNRWSMLVWHLEWAEMLPGGRRDAAVDQLVARLRSERPAARLS